MPSLSRLSVIVLLAPALLAACASSRLGPGFLSAAQPESAEAIRTELAAGRPLEALLLIRKEIELGEQESDFAAEYAAAINDVLAAARRHQKAQRYSQAGELLCEVLQAWPKEPAVAARIERSRTEVAAERRSCADQLMELGLVEYRGGRLKDAISWWQKVLAIDPAHQAARQAVETASVQLKNLRTIK